ncbi:guanyl nucleotide binding protein [Moniliophthora roreri MCA 2997]|uniref:Guanyl nucleotide binding protein n=1 Tax=Moniliophthora roreri (strain MCA 2997) TaxID=1381753 RepID=V2XHK1_MONRO|nr:guanyl nucleotide binding protein [Moniliophthora roreri MCA 2997]
MSTAVEELQATWSPPLFDLTKPPDLTESLESDQELGNFVRIAKWCPDGSMALAQCENSYYTTLNFNSLPEAEDPQRTRLILRQPAPIIDFLWYPTASSRNPSSFCFVSSVRECPVKLLDASNGRLRASYPIIDHRERFIASHSLSFNLYGTRLYCGFKDAIEVFDVGQPGEGTRLPTTPSKKSKDGLKGIISSLAFCPSYTSDYYAAGSLSPTESNIALFNETQGEIPVMFLSGGAKAGVTQLQFNPMQPHLLYASYRRRDEIYCWDLRGSVDTPSTTYSPPSGYQESTNQKRRFDVDIGGRWLAVGSQTGDVSLFDLNSTGANDAATISPTQTYKAHEGTYLFEPSSPFFFADPLFVDAIGCVAFRPNSGHLLSASGSRHYPSSDSEEDDRPVMKKRYRKPIARDTSIKLWHF